MTDLQDPGTPEARRAWLNSLPVGAVVVDASGVENHRLPRGWRDRGGVMPGCDFETWCADSGFWPAQSVTLPTPTMHDTAHAIATWQAATFGPPGDPLVTLAKMRDEVAELEHELRQQAVPGLEGAQADRIRVEAADVVFMVLDLMRHHGGPDTLAAAMAAKLERNRARSWSQAPDGKWSGSKPA